MPLIFLLKIKAAQAHKNPLRGRSFASFFYSALLIHPYSNVKDNTSILGIRPRGQGLNLRYNLNHDYA